MSNLKLAAQNFPIPIVINTAVTCNISLQQFILTTIAIILLKCHKKYKNGPLYTSIISKKSSKIVFLDFGWQLWLSVM